VKDGRLALEKLNLSFFKRACALAFSFCLIKKKQKIKTNPIPPGVLSGFPHLGGYLSIGLENRKLLNKRSIG
jgi:hypothetical protein